MRPLRGRSGERSPYRRLSCGECSSEPAAKRFQASWQAIVDRTQTRVTVATRAADRSTLRSRMDCLHFRRGQPSVQRRRCPQRWRIEGGCWAPVVSPDKQATLATAVMVSANPRPSVSGFYKAFWLLLHLVSTRPHSLRPRLPVFWPAGAAEVAREETCSRSATSLLARSTKATCLPVCISTGTSFSGVFLRGRRDSCTHMQQLGRSPVMQRCPLSMRRHLCIAATEKKTA